LSSGQNLPFKAGYFDKILLIDVLEHMEDNLKAKVLKECFRVLRTEGSLLINTPNLNYLTQGLRFKRIIRKLTLRNPLKLDIPLTPNSSIKDDHVDLTTTALLKKMLYNSGFKDVEFLLKTDNIYGILLMPLYLCSLNMKESLCQSITLKCIK
jgi:ubiquinone/menaquinone biosynthesis C-methylase UbiE